MRNHTFTRTHLSIRSLLLCAVAVVLMLGCEMVGHAQDDQLQIMPARGFHPTHGYDMGGIETISTTSGNLMLDIPLAALPAGRGGHPGFQLRLRYNSKVWDGNADKATNPDRPSQTIDVVWLVTAQEGGWRYNIPKRYSWNLDNRNNHGVIYPPSDLRHTHIWKLKMKFPDGSSREMRPYGFDDGFNDGYFAVQPSAGMSYYSTDGSYVRLDIGAPGSWTLNFPDGTKVVNVSPGVQRTFDRHGAFIENTFVSNYNGTGHNADIITDQLSRSIVIEYGTGEDYIRAVGVGGNPIVTTVKWANTYVTKMYRAGNHFQYDTNITNKAFKVVTEIDLPSQLGAGMKYLFGYNGWPATNMGTSVGWGELSSITMPSGCAATYQYNMDNKSGSVWQANMVLANSPTRKDLNYSLEYDGVTTAAPTETWLYNIGGSGAMITGPDGGITQESFSPSPTLGRIYKTRRPDGSVVERIWKENRPYLPPGVTISTSAVVNPFVEAEFLSIPDAGGTLVLTSSRHYSYDKNGNVIQVKEYDWVPYGNVPRDSLGKPTGIPASAPLKRVTTSTYHCETATASNTTTDDPDTYDRASAPQLLNAVKSKEIGNGTQVLSRREYSYDNPLSTGRLTEERSWDSSKGPINGQPPLLDVNNSIATSTQYNTSGMPSLIIDAVGTRTLMTYGDIGNGVSDLYPTQIEMADLTAVERTERREYDFNTGLVTKVTDVENDVITSTSYDVFGRATLVRAAEGRPEESRIATEYSDLARRVITRADLNTIGDGKLVSVKHYDQLGRVRLSRRLEDASQNPELEADGIKVQTRYRYSTGNAFQLTSNPYRAANSGDAGSEPTMGWTRTKSDLDGRIVEMQTFSGSGLPAPWDLNASGTGTITTAYDANFTTVTDQAGKVRRSKTDGLGRLVRVDEPSDANNTLGSTASPTQPTSYEYDALNNLKLVTQAGQTPRSFNYTSLSRLKDATNPESGTISYTYDGNGNLKTRTEPRFVPNTSTLRTVTYNYDALGRLTTRTYNDGTPDVTFAYDAAGVLFSKGKLTSASSSVSTYAYLEYDPLGRVKSTKQTTDGQDYTMGYSYNRAGSLVSQTYPSGRIVATNYDDAGRVAGVKNGVSQAYYAGALSSDTTNRMQYSAAGALQVMKMGNNLWEHNNFNSRLQITQIGVGTNSTDSSKLKLDYSYGVIVGGNLDASKNNGSLQSQTITVPGAAAIVQNYEYDELDRLKRAEELGGGGWTEQFSYDRFGNRIGATITDNPNSRLPTLAPEIDPANNRFKVLNSQGQPTGYTYDEVGNLTQEPEPGASTFKKYAYDGENHLIQAKRKDGAVETEISTYHYDAELRRVKTIVGGVTKVYVYDVQGKMIAEYGGAPGSSAGVTYITADTLGSTRLTTASDGQVKERRDYLPYGEEIPTAYNSRSNVTGYGVDILRQKFIGKERDTETGLDYLSARYNSTRYGRFTSVDPDGVGAFANVPQTWNGYSYAAANPIKFSDPSGLVLICRMGGKLVTCQQALDKISKGEFETVTYTSSTGVSVTVRRADFYRPGQTTIRPDGTIVTTTTFDNSAFLAAAARIASLARGDTRLRERDPTFGGGFGGGDDHSGAGAGGSWDHCPSCPAFNDDPYNPDVVEGRRRGFEPVPATTAERATALGFNQRVPPQRVPFNSHGQEAYFDGRRYITPDVDEHHAAGGWKMFVRQGGQWVRQGTYDANLNYIGP